jgi:hypothetical protein
VFPDALAAREGFRSPAESELITYLDIVASVNGILLDSDAQEVDVLSREVAANVGRPIILEVYNVKANRYRTCQVVPNDKWGGEGLMGVQVRWDVIEEPAAVDCVLHVVGVEEGSPAAAAGLVAEKDFILGSVHTSFASVDAFGDYVASREAGDVHVYVLNSDTDRVRVVALPVSDEPWGPERQTGLGIELATGHLHGMPNRHSMGGNEFETGGQVAAKPQEAPTEAGTSALAHPAQSPSPVAAAVAPQPHAVVSAPPPTAEAYSPAHYAPPAASAHVPAVFSEGSSHAHAHGHGDSCRSAEHDHHAISDTSAAAHPHAEYASASDASHYHHAGYPAGGAAHSYEAAAYPGGQQTYGLAGDSHAHPQQHPQQHAAPDYSTHAQQHYGGYATAASASPAYGRAAAPEGHTYAPSPSAPPKPAATIASPFAAPLPAATSRFHHVAHHPHPQYPAFPAMTGAAK